MNTTAKMLRDAVKKIRAKDIDPYLKLLEWLDDNGMRKDFETLFKKYYGLNAGGLTDEWKKRYFELLFSVDTKTMADPYTHVLKDLYIYPRRKGDLVLQFSFVSKLVAIHDESKPLYDKHVSSFFGLKPPESASIDFRIAGFLRNQQLIQATYAEWLWKQDFVDVLKDFRHVYPQIATRHPNRLFDFLVWSVGRYKLN